MQSKTKEGDYKSVRDAIAGKLETDDYDDGASLGRYFDACRGM